MIVTEGDANSGIKEGGGACVAVITPCLRWSGCQEDLGGISADIKTLQDKSLDMNIKLKNRRAVEGQLRDYIDQVLVSNTLIAYADFTALSCSTLFCYFSWRWFFFLFVCLFVLYI